MSNTRLIFGPELHQAIILEQLLEARSYVWIATADLKDMHVKAGRRFKPILSVFDEMASRGVNFRVIHGSLPSRPFRETLDDFPGLVSGGLELQICPRSHWKIILVDGRFAYWGSANFTGAGLGAKSPRKRNFEVGTVTEDGATIAALAEQFDQFWIGQHCEDCGLRQICPDPIR